MTWPQQWPPPWRGESPEAAVTTPPKAPLAWPHQPAGAQQAPATPYHYPHDAVRWPQGDFEYLRKITDIPADTVPLPANGLGGLVESGQLVLYGGSFLNASTAAGTLTIRDGMDASGGFLAQVTVPASGNAQLTVPRAGLLIEIGLFVVPVSALISGSLWVCHLWKYPFTPAGE